MPGWGPLTADKKRLGTADLAGFCPAYKTVVILKHSTDFYLSKNTRTCRDFRQIKEETVIALTELGFLVLTCMGTCKQLSVILFSTNVQTGWVIKLLMEMGFAFYVCANKVCA